MVVPSYVVMVFVAALTTWAAVMKYDLLALLPIHTALPLPLCTTVRYTPVFEAFRRLSNVTKASAKVSVSALPPSAL